MSSSATSSVSEAATAGAAAAAAAATADVIKYYLKFAINVPHADVTRMLQSDSRLLYGLKDCSRAGRVNWKLKLYKHQTGPDEFLAVYLKFEPQACTESVSCSTEFSVKLIGPEGRSLERRSSSKRQFTKVDDSWGWSQFVRTSELDAFVSAPDGSEVLKLSGVIKIFESSKLLYPHRRHNFTRPQNGADFKLLAGQVTFHVHRAVLALNSDYFAGMFARGTSEEARKGQVALTEEKVQDVHLLLQFMYPGYSRVLEEATLLPLSRMAATYQVHSLAWACMQFMDSRLAELPEPERVMKYYWVCVRSLRCPDLGEQCARVAARHPWQRIKEAPHFRQLDEPEKAAFLEAYLDFKEAAVVGTSASATEERPPGAALLASGVNGVDRDDDDDELDDEDGDEEDFDSEGDVSSDTAGEVAAAMASQQQREAFVAPNNSTTGL